MTKKPKIQTNEGPPDKHVEIIANVVKRPDSTYPAVIKPYKLDLSQFTDKVRDKISFDITNVSDVDLNLKLIAGYDDLFTLDLPKSIGAGKTAKAVLKLKKDAIAESFEKSFTFEFDDEKNSRFTVPVKRTLRQTAKATNVRPKAGK